MTPRTISLIASRNAEAQRAHFAIFVPAAASPDQGTLIQAVGAPMMGYMLEFKRNYALADSVERYTIVPVGDIDSTNIVDSTDGVKTSDSVPRGTLEVAAAQIPTPGISENFLAPVNDTTNKRCQEWTMEFIRALVGRGLLESEAIRVVQSKRDSASHGIGLQPALPRSS
ncbi:hypothetical protein N7492_009409 [Penicillium capsulatum]|uniref:Uncharacterized protein n=1 Tax=Penicillium capsulatum TaxID=69766 RepID=A0A9W9HV98_9EURO|nr:hypothetical protein N7492_009409 [Penicillium capsulatum]KAJ6106802.1 hypothetical protein N7512_010319 [Penicillium capsulatum]